MLCILKESCSLPDTILQMRFLRNKLLITSLLMSLVSLIGAYIILETRCFRNSCSSDLLRSILRPLFWFFAPFTILLIPFFFFSTAIYSAWLKYVALWYLPVLLLVTLSTPVYSSNIFAYDRSQVALFGVILLGIITIPFVWWEYKRLQTK
jgi:hypothetical protein